LNDLGPDSHALVWFDSTSPSLSNLSLFLSLPVCEGRGVWRRIIWPQKSFVLYKSFNTLWLAGCCLCCMCCRLYRSLELPIKMIS
jgi:hypothetical protein